MIWFILGLFVVVFGFFYVRHLIYTHNRKVIFDLIDSKIKIFICGDLGTGKDCLGSAYCYGKPHNCNIPYQINTNVIKLKDLVVPGISYNKLGVIDNLQGLGLDWNKYSFLNDITIISDSNIYFPNSFDSELKEYFKEFPFQMAIWRHLFDKNIIFNCQLPDRIWKSIRDQVDSVILCNGCSWHKRFVDISVIFYDRIEDYEKGYICNVKDKKSIEGQIFNANLGYIKNCKIRIPKKWINHDSRYFRKIVFSSESLKGGVDSVKD